MSQTFGCSRDTVLKVVLCCCFLSGCGLEVKPSLAPPRRQHATNVAKSEEMPSPETKAEEPSRVTSKPIEPTFPPDAKPAIFATETLHVFGTMDPYTLGQHDFKIKNNGDGPLLLKDHRSSCKCTVGSYPRRPILPGEETDISVVWKTQSNDGVFEHTTAVLTNDPAMPELELTIRGSVLVHVGANPQTFNFSDVRPDQTAEVSSIVSSQVWERFAISDISSSLTGATWDLRLATKEELAKANSISGHQLTVRLPKLAPGFVDEVVKFRVTPEGEESKWFELPMKAKILRRVAVYGTGLDATGTVDLGVIDASRGHSRRLFVKVYDRESRLELKDIQAHPSFVQVRFSRHNDVTPGLYRLELVVPPNSPACRHQAKNAGTLQIRFKHPRIAELRLRLSLAVADELATYSSLPPQY